MKTAITSFCYLLIFSLFIIPSNSIAENKKPEILKLVVRPNKKAGEPASKLFKNKLLKLILEKTEPKYGPFEIKEFRKRIKQSRVIDLIKEGNIFRITATMTSTRREKDLWPIRIPVFKGLLGYRIFIIRKEDQPFFSKITTLKEVKALKAIQGHDWPDSDILASNGFSLYRSTNYRGIFQMLRSKRGDYFPRGVHEPWAELIKNPSLNLSVEKKLLVQYNAPFYFFVKYGDKKLYERIKKGFLMTVKDGSFDALFYSDPEIRNIFKRANITGRKIFRIKNFYLPKETPLHRKKWWYRAGDEKRYYSLKKKQSKIHQ